MINCRLATLLIALLFLTQHAYGATFTETDSTVIALDAAIESLKKEPNQFNLTVTTVGVMATASNGGTGLSVQANGGGPGSTTVGLIASPSGGNIQLTQATADDQLKREAEKAVQLLQEIRGLLTQKKIDKPTIKSKLEAFSQTYVAPVLKSIIEALLKKRLGL
jgi:hypothetical protein